MGEDEQVARLVRIESAARKFLVAFGVYMDGRHDDADNADRLLERRDILARALNRDDTVLRSITKE
jgi:hypothetical protein